MRRREFGKTSLRLVGATLLAVPSEAAAAEGADAAIAAPAIDFPKTPGLTQYVGQFVLQTKYENIPTEVIDLGKKSILDGFGLALAGSRAESGPISRKYIEQCGGNGKATVIGTAMKTSPRFAALLNGISIHADDFDDTQLAAAKDRVYGLLMHPTVPVLPAIFALAEQRTVRGKEWLLAYQIGAEGECKIAEAISPRHYQDGFHTTGTCGPFGSAAACAKLLGFNLGETLNSFGLAASQSGGLRENFGTMTKPYQAGHAAESGLVAAEMAGLGWTAAEQILEAERGFFHGEGGRDDPSAITNRLGHPWTFADPGVSLKPYPSGSLAPPAMPDLARLIAVNDIQAAQVEKVDVGANHNMTTTLLHHNPKTGLEAKFSMEFCIAILLLERKAGLGQFSDKVAQRPDVREIIRKINFYVDPQAESAGFDEMTSILKITLKNGKVIAGQAAFGKGSPANPMSFDEASEKFRGCAEFAEWPQEKTEMIIAFVKTLEAAPNMSALTPLLSSAAG